jgi:hypothetical protein
VLAVPPSALAGYARHWPGALTFRHQWLNGREILDGLDRNIS